MTSDQLPRPTDDELVARYHEATALEDAAPGPDLRDAILAQAQVLAWKHADTMADDGEPAIDEVAAGARPASAEPVFHSELPPPPAPAVEAANDRRWFVPAVASVAVLGLAGLLALQFGRAPADDQDVALGRATAPQAEPAAPAAPAAADVEAKAAAADQATAAAPAAEPARPAEAPSTDAPAPPPSVAAPPAAAVAPPAPVARPTPPPTQPPRTAAERARDRAAERSSADAAKAKAPPTQPAAPTRDETRAAPKSEPRASPAPAEPPPLAGTSEAAPPAAAAAPAAPPIPRPRPAPGGEFAAAPERYEHDRGPAARAFPGQRPGRADRQSSW